MPQWEYHLWRHGTGWYGFCPNQAVKVWGPTELKTLEILKKAALKNFRIRLKNSAKNVVE